MIEERLLLVSERLREIPQETCTPEPFRTFFKRTAEFLLAVMKDADSRSLLLDILPGHYEASFANPDYASRILGAEFGPLLSAVCAELRGYIPAVFRDDRESCAIYLELFLEIYGEFYGEELPGVSTIRGIFAAYLSDYLSFFLERWLRTRPGPAGPAPDGIFQEEPLVIRSSGLWERSEEDAPNRQYLSDHREDLALVLDDHFVSHFLRSAQEVFQTYARETRKDIRAEGEKRPGGGPPAPEAHRAAPAFTAKQREQMVRLREGLRAIRARYIPE